MGDIDGPRRRDEVTLQRVGDEAILHDPVNRRTHVVNRSAAVAWELCDGRPFDDLVRAFADAFAVDEARVRPDVTAVLARFREQGLLA